MSSKISMGALGISVFVSASNDVIPNDEGYVKEESIDSDILQSIWPKMFKTELNMGMRRTKSDIDSISEPQLQNEFK